MFRSRIPFLGFTFFGSQPWDKTAPTKPKLNNTEQYGYAKSQQLHFLPGAGDNTASNMGQVTAVRDSQLLDVFREEEYTLLEGRHIQPEDSFAVLLSKELTDKNGLSVGDSVTMYDLDTDSENTFTIVGIFGGTEGMTKDAMMADGIAANQGYIDGNSYQKMWNETTLELGSLDVYVDSAQRVQQVLEAIQALPQLRGKTFTYSTDTEQFDLISTPLSSLQRMMDAAVAGIAVTGAVLAALLLLLRPPCLILESTGYYCGACGVTRLVEELLQGHVEAAFRQNVYMFFVLPLAALWLVGEAACYLGGRRPLWKRRWMQALLVCVAAAGVAFTVLRNLPGLECLQPHGL